MIKNDPYKILEKEGTAKKLLSEHVKEALKEYDETLRELKKLPGEKSLVEIAEQIGAEVAALVSEDVKRIKETLKDDVKDKQEKELKKAQSKEVVEKVQQSLDYLAECRRRLKEERARKIQSGEIKAPVKKRLSTKLKDRLNSLVSLMPKSIGEDKSKMAQTQKAIMEFLSKLKRIWGMNTIKPIEKELKERFKEMEEKHEKKQASQKTVPQK